MQYPANHSAFFFQLLHPIHGPLFEEILQFPENKEYNVKLFYL